jgi:hypothetical protein
MGPLGRSAQNDTAVVGWELWARDAALRCGGVGGLLSRVRKHAPGAPIFLLVWSGLIVAGLGACFSTLRAMRLREEWGTRASLGMQEEMPQPGWLRHFVCACLARCVCEQVLHAMPAAPQVLTSR